MMRRVGIGAAIAVLAVGFAATSAWANAPVIKVRPSTTNLTNNERIRVHARRLPSTWSWLAAECDAQFPAHGTDDCDAGVIEITEGRTGAMFSLKLKTGATGNPAEHGKCGKSTANNDCVIALIPQDQEGTPEPADAITIPISFARAS